MSVHLEQRRSHVQHAESLGWLEQVRSGVDACLFQFFRDKRHETQEMSLPTMELVVEIEALTMRGGKRLRPAVATAAYRCVRPGQGMERLAELGGSLELLQSYLLIHDDWMDHDEIRRGGAAVHTSLQRTHADVHLGAALGVLAGDLASAYAWELFLRAPYSAQTQSTAASAFVQTQKEVYCGQHLDLIGDADVARMHGLKTTSYTVKGPMLLGALLGEPSHEQLQAIHAWATPIGEAFQIRDDLLGALGSPDNTGKPALDLQHGKLSRVLLELRQTTTPQARASVERIIGESDVSVHDLDAARDALFSLGVVERLEDRIRSLREQADRTLQGAPFSAQGREMLSGLANKLTIRRS